MVRGGDYSGGERRISTGPIARGLFQPPHHEFRAEFRAFVQKEIVPANGRWERDGIVSRRLFTVAGKAGYLGRVLPVEHGGLGEEDFRFSQIMAEECELAGVAAAGSGLGLHNDMVVPYFARYASPGQAERWFPGLCSGARIGAIAITEPAAGSDMAGLKTTAKRTQGGYILNGCKTLIGNGTNADLVIVAARQPRSARHNGISLFVVQGEATGLGRTLIAKLGRRAQDTSTLTFDGVFIANEDVLGERGNGFGYIMANLPQERLNIASAAVAGSRYALDLTLEYVRERNAFGRPIGSFQHVRFLLAEMETEIQVAQVFVDRCVECFNSSSLTPTQAAMAKWWCTELQRRVTDTCLQLHGGHGYREDMPISRAWRDGRVTTIYGGTTEIMKEIISRSLDL